MLGRFSKRSPFGGFLIAGGLAAGTNFASRILFSLFVSYAVAIVLAYLVGMVTAFVLMRGQVFRSSGKPLRAEIFAFIVVNFLAVLQTLAVSLILARYLFPWLNMQWHAEAVAHAIGIAVPTVISFFGHKHWTFARR